MDAGAFVGSTGDNVGVPVGLKGAGITMDIGDSVDSTDVGVFVGSFVELDTRPNVGAIVVLTVRVGVPVAMGEIEGTSDLNEASLVGCSSSASVQISLPPITPMGVMSAHCWAF